MLGKDFQRHAALQLGVLGFVHHAHPAAADLADDAVVCDRFREHIGAGEARMLVGHGIAVNVGWGMVTGRGKVIHPSRVC